MEVVASLAAVLQIAGELGQLSQDVSRCVKKIKYAKKQIAAVDRDVNLFSCTFNLFHTTVQTAKDQNLPLAEDPMVSKLVHHIWCAGVTRLADIHIILETLNGLRVDNGSGASRMTARFFWLILDQRDIKDSLSGMHTVCTAINTFYSATMLHLLLKQIEMLQAENERVPKKLRKKIELLRAEVERRAEYCEEAQQRYETLRLSTGTSGESTPMIEIVTRLVKQIARNEVRREREIVSNTSSAVSSQPSSHPPPNIPGPGPSMARTNSIYPSSSSHTSVRMPHLPPLEPETPIDTNLESSRPSRVSRYPRTRASSSSSWAGEVQIVIHDDGTMVHEELRRPRRPVNNTTDSKDDDGSIQGPVD